MSCEIPLDKPASCSFCEVSCCSWLRAASNLGSWSRYTRNLMREHASGSRDYGSCGLTSVRQRRWKYWSNCSIHVSSWARFWNTKPVCFSAKHATLWLGVLTAVPQLKSHQEVHWIHCAIQNIPRTEVELNKPYVGHPWRTKQTNHMSSKSRQKHNDCVFLMEIYTQCTKALTIVVEGIRRIIERTTMSVTDGIRVQFSPKDTGDWAIMPKTTWDKAGIAKRSSSINFFSLFFLCGCSLFFSHMRAVKANNLLFL